MQTIQVALNEKLLKAAELAAKRRNLNRSALIREALGEYLKRLHAAELDERDRRGFEACPPQTREIRMWEDVAAWPEN